MPYITTKKWYTPELVRANRDVLFVFGDNAERVGHGGQAVIRDEPNVIGVATKLDPAHYFNDASQDDFDTMRMDLAILTDDLFNGETVVLPEGGLGTGLSDMPNQCPHLFELLEAHVQFIKDNFEQLEDNLKEAPLFDLPELE